MKHQTRGEFELGVVTTLPSTLGAVEYGLAAEALGFDRVAFGDTAPKLYHLAYPAITALLLQSQRVKVGPYVTNPISRHWSVHMANARAFEELAPGRFFLGIATGDGAVHSVGLKPARLAELRDAVVAMRQNGMPATTPVHMTFSGPKGVELAGEIADELTVAVGLDVPSLREFAARARAARRAAGITEPLKIWLPVQVQFSESPDDIPMLRQAAAGMTSLSARFTFASSFEGKHVPEPYQNFIRQALKHYDFGHHASFAANPNAALFDERPEIRDYVIDRFSLVGSPEQCAERLADVVREAELDGVWVFPVSLTRDPADVRRKLEIAARHFADLSGGN